MSNGVFGVTDPVLERAGDRDRLERRAGLVVEARSPRSSAYRGRAAVVGVTRPVGERQDRAVARVHHDRGRALRRVLGADFGQHPLDLVLKRRVDRQRHRLAGHGRPQVVDRDRLADRVVDDPTQPVRARAARCRTGTRCRWRRRRPGGRCRPPARPRSPRGYTRRVCGNQRDAGDSQVRDRRSPGPPEADAPGTRIPVCGLVSSFSTVSCGFPSSDESCADAETAFLIRYGSATMSSADSLSRQLGSVAVGDRAARSRHVTLLTCCVAAARSSDPARTEPR